MIVGLKKQPHLVWNGSDFAPGRPAPPPKLKIDVTLMRAAHRKFGCRWKEKGWKQSPLMIDAVADTGCQTCTAGTDIIKQLCPLEYLVPTRHKIVGITDTSLSVVGMALIQISCKNGRETKQAVYVSERIQGLYLSESALKELGLVSGEFPHQGFEGDLVRSQSVKSTDEKLIECECLPRMPTPTRPSNLPYEPIVENIPRMKKWLLDKFKSSAFNTCAHQPLQTMTGEPVKVQFKEEAKPCAVHTPIPVPFHWKYQVKEEIERDVRLGIIEPVPQGAPTKWCSRMVVTSKKDGSPRRTVDLQKLNKATLRETHHTPSPFNLVSSIPNHTRKTVLDAWNGYHSLKLAGDAKESTTFITEWGRYRYCRAPMGFHASGDAYTRRFDDITVGFPRVKRCIDDSVLWDPEEDVEATFWHAFDYIKLCGDNGIVFNKDKFVFGEQTVEFAGFEVHREGFRPPRRIIEAIESFPTPRSITDIRSWFGLVNQVAYAFSQAELMAPFRELLASKKRTFYWDHVLDDIFVKSKKEVIRCVEDGVKTFEMGRQTCLTTDWSKVGIGFSLWQKHCNCSGPVDPNCGGGHWKMVYAGSRFTRDAESRYAPIEGEALAFVFGLISCKMYTLGNQNLIVATDHKPLIRIFNDRDLDTIENPRIRNLKEKSLQFQFEVKYIEGGLNCTADWSSRNPIKNWPDKGESICEETCFARALQLKDLPASVTWEQVREAAKFDEECALLCKEIANGFPEVKDGLPPQLRVYWPMRHELYEIEGVPFKGCKMLIPKKLRGKILKGLHAANQGVTGMQANASERFFWPGLNAAINQLRQRCVRCNSNAPSQHAEPTILTPPPEYPFQQVATDFADIEGHDFLVYADRYSGWLEVAKLHSKTEKSVKETFLKWFSTYGVPEEMASDGGPPFNSAGYDDFLMRWGIKKRLSSAYYPQSNGRAEAAVKSAKRILEGNIDRMTGKLNTEEATRAIMMHRNTPLQETGCSPAMTLFGRPMRDHLPRRQTSIRRVWEDVADARESAAAKRQLRNNPNIINEGLKPLSVGDSVQVQNQVGNRPRRWYATGQIIECLPYRQYRVLVDGSRRTTLRNRRFLKLIDPICRGSPLPETGTRVNTEEGNPPKAAAHPEAPPQQQEVQEVGLIPRPIEGASTPNRPILTINSPRRIVNAEMDNIEGGASDPLQEETLASQEQQTPVARVEEPMPAPVQLRRGTRVRRKPVRYSP